MMNEFVLPDGTKVYHYKTDKFKSISVRLMFPAPLNEGKYMAHDILGVMLSTSNKKYPKENDYTRYLKGLYQTKILPMSRTMIKKHILVKKDVKNFT